MGDAMKTLLAAVLLICTASGQQIYDFLLKNGRVMDPANHRDGQMDVAVVGNKIVRIAPNLPVAHARVVVDVSGYLVTPGLIDNVHFGAELKPDYNTLPYGVTTAVDSGSATCATFPSFKKEVIDHAKTRVLAFISGDAECTSRLVSQNQGIVVSRAADPSSLEASINLPQPFRVLKERAGFLVGTISSGMDANNVLLPRVNMSTAMSIYLNLGMTPERIVERVTSNAARAIRRTELGALNDGGVADIAVLEIQQGRFGFLDSARMRLDADRRFRCVLTVRNGAIVWDSEGLSIPDTIRAGPYTNFK
jgi:predicted amidohydrolase